jgi:hypothetical protein
MLFYLDICPSYLAKNQEYIKIVLKKLFGSFDKKIHEYINLKLKAQQNLY